MAFPVGEEYDQGSPMKAEVVVARQPILDRQGLVVAQELLFREAGDDIARIQDGYSATAAVVERTLGVLGIEYVLGHDDGFLHRRLPVFWRGRCIAAVALRARNP
jgi:hypothetical protein